MDSRLADNEWLSSDRTNKNFISLYRERCLLGFYGWRRRCLFIVLTILLLFAIFNLALTLWILKVMEFSSNGLGPLKVLPGGVQLNGEAMVLGNLISSRIGSRKGQTMQIQGSQNITLQAKSLDERILSQLTLGVDKLDIIGSSLRISDSFGRTLFSADKNDVLIGADALVVTGEGGGIFHGSLQTSKVKAESGHELRLESPTRSLDISGTSGVNIVSGAGDIFVLALGDIKLQSQSGTVRFEAPNIYFPKLDTAATDEKIAIIDGGINYKNQPPKPSSRVYQVCICQKGKLFLAPPDGDCVADNDVCR